MGTVSCCNRLSANWSRGSRMVAQTFSMRKEPDAHLRPSLMQKRNESVTRSWRTDGWQLVKWHIDCQLVKWHINCQLKWHINCQLVKWHTNCQLVTFKPVKLSTTGCASIKSAHDGSQSTSKNCTNRNIWMSSNVFWITVVLKMTTSWKESSRETKHGSTIMSQSVEKKHRHLPARRKLKTHPIAGKLMLIVFWDSQGLLVEQYQESVQQCTELAKVGRCVTS